MTVVSTSLQLFVHKSGRFT